MKESPAKIVRRLMGSTFGQYAAIFLQATSWRGGLALTLVLCRSAAQGAQLALLVPLMQLIGLNVQEGSLGKVEQFVSHAFATVGLRPTLATVLGAFVLFSALLAAITRFQSSHNFKLEQDFVAYLRGRVYRSIVNTSWPTFSRSRSSDFTHVLTTELDRVGFATASLLDLSASLILVSVYVLFALQLSAALTVLVFISGAGLLLSLRSKARVARQTGEDISMATADLYSAATEHISSMKTTKSYGAEERNADMFSEQAERVARTYFAGSRNYAETTFWFNLGSVTILSGILFVSLTALNLSAAGLALLLLLYNRMIPLFNAIQQNYQQCLNMLPAFARVLDIWTQCNATAEPKGELSAVTKVGRGIRFEKVSFSYGGDEGLCAARDIDLTINTGEITAIVGPSGAGKSTIAELVMGLIVPSRGRILVDDVPLSVGRTRSWRNQIGYVAQDTFLFNDTVRANLLWACPDASSEEINRALEMAAAEEFTSNLPDGLETILGDRGTRLSGGERQRLALARALLRKPSLLILDEATSSLDSENEKRIQNAIEQLHGRITILAITHRLSTIRRADVIHVLDAGRLVESGSWEALVGKENGRFSTLAEAQGIIKTSQPQQ